MAPKSGSTPATPQSVPTPALFTSTSSRPGSSVTSAAARSMLAGSDTSSTSGRAPTASAASRALPSSRALRIDVVAALDQLARGLAADPAIGAGHEGHCHGAEPTWAEAYLLRRLGMPFLVNRPGRLGAVRKAAALAILGAMALIVPLTAGAAGRDTDRQTYVVLLERGASVDAAKAAVKGAGGRVVSVNRKVGVATVRSSNADFVTDVSRTRGRAGRGPQPRRGRGPGRQAQRPVRHRAHERAPRPRRGQRPYPPRRRAQAGAARGAVRGPPVGHEGDPRHADEVVPPPARQQRRARGDHRHRHRRVASRHRAELQPRR